MYDAVLTNDYQIIQSGVLLLALIFVARQPGGRRQLRLPEPEDPLLVSSHRHHLRRPSPRTSRSACGATRSAGCGTTRPRSSARSIVGAMVFMAVFAPFLAPYDPTARQPVGQLPAAVVGALDGDQHPGPGRALADHLGRSADARDRRAVRHDRGHRSAASSAPWPASSRAAIDGVIMRTVDIMLAIPGLLLAIGIVTFLGRGVVQIAMAIAIVNVPIFARLLRSSLLGLRDADYVIAARSVGVRGPAILHPPHAAERDRSADRPGAPWPWPRPSSTRRRSASSGSVRTRARRSGGRCCRTRIAT